MEFNMEHGNATASRRERMFTEWCKLNKIAISKLTHGEQYHLRYKYNYLPSLEMDNRVVPSSNIKNRMSRNDALNYYNKNLMKHWDECLSDGLKKRPNEIRMKILDFMMRRVA